MRHRQKLLCVLLSLFAAVFLLQADASENHVSVLVQAESIPDTYIPNLRDSYVTDDGFALWQLEFDSLSEAQNALAAVESESEEINTIINESGETGTQFSAYGSPFPILNGQQEDCDIAWIARGEADHPLLRAVPLSDSEPALTGGPNVCLEAFDSDGNTDLSLLCTSILYAVKHHASAIILPLDEDVISVHPLLLSTLQYAHAHGISVYRDVQEYQNADQAGKSEIVTFEASLKEGAVYEEGSGEYVWFPQTGAEGQRFTYRVSYSLSGIYEMMPESMHIYLPKHILSTRDSQIGDFAELSVLPYESAEEDDLFAYTENDYSIEIFNRKTLPSASEGFFEISYVTSEETFEYRDGDHSSVFHAQLLVENEEDTASAQCTADAFRVDTSSKILSTVKHYPVKFPFWNDAWMEQPADSVNEEYLIWEIRSYIRQNSTQPYTFVLEEDISSEETDTRILGYRFMDSDHFVSENSISSQTQDQLRVDYVLSAHKKCDADQFSIENRITAKLIPEDGLDEPSEAFSKAVYTEEKAVFHEPTGSIGAEKYAGEMFYNLELLQQGKIHSINNLPYHILMEGYPYEWTRNDSDDPLDPSSYGKNKVKYVFTDDSLCLNGEENPLNPEDFTLDSMHIDFLFEDAVFDEETQSFQESEVSFETEDTISFYGLFDDGWQRIGIRSLFTGTDEFNTSLAAINDDEIVFRMPCHGFRIETENAHYHTRAAIDLSISLHDTDHVKGMIVDQDQITLTNTGTFSLMKNYAEIISLQRSASDFIRRTFRDSDLKKRVIASANDIASKQYTITWKVNLNEWITGTDGLRVPYSQSSGTFYDLLPAGSLLDESSLSVMNEKGELDSSTYDVERFENFRGSGRTMLKVDVHEKGDAYTLFYDTYHSWESIRDYGTSLLNPVAYETGNEDIADGFCDNGSGLSDINRGYLSNLDSECQTARFVYTEQPHDITAITSAIAGLCKQVRCGSPQYSYEDVTSAGQIYSYRLRYETSDDSSADHMIFFDSLENYVTEDHKTSAWHGTLQSVDVSQLIAKGIEPVIYISTAADLDIASHHDLSDSSIWTDDLTNIENAKAVAVDMTHGADGNTFVLSPSQSVAVTLYMKAPSLVTVDPFDNKAFNNVWFSSVLHGSFSEEEDYLIHQDFTAVSYEQQADLHIKKISADNPEETISGINFELSGVSVYGKPVFFQKTTRNDGTLTVSKVPKGTYVLKETGSHPDWIKDESEHEIIIVDDHTVLYDGIPCESNTVIITNQRRIHADFSFEKRDLVYPDKPVVNVEFRLSGTSDYGNEIVMYSTSSTTGSVVFHDLEAGSYTLHEAQSPSGYLKDETNYPVIIDQGGTIRFSGSYTDQSGRFILYNEPLHELKLIKKSAYDSSLIPGARFVLKGVADDGTEYRQEASSNQRGIVLFTGLHAGTYTLSETEAPEGYDRDTAVHAVRINHDGSIECDELESDQDGNLILLNQPALNQSIRIIKRWMDDGTAERPIPVIHLSNTIPEPVIRTATIDIEKWLDEDTGIAVIEEAVWFEENTALTKEEVLAKENLIRVDDEQTEYSMYLWPEDDGYAWWSDADVIQLPEDCSGMFAYCTELEALDLSQFSSDLVTDMYGMFRNCSSLTEVDISHFNTENVTDMGEAFKYCQSLSYLNLVGINTSNVIAMNSMFTSCSSLTEIDLSSFNTAQVEYMDSMFNSCSKLTAIYASETWSIENVHSGRDMFKNCRKLSGYNKNKVDSSYAHYGEGGYLTYRAYESGTSAALPSLHNSLFTTVNAEEVQEYVSDSSAFVTSSTDEEEKELILHNREGYWQMLDTDTWVYTFPVVNDEDEFWFYEEDMEGWNSNADIYHPGIVQNKTGTIINFHGINPITGDMNITKDVISDSTQTRKFNFTITLHNEKGEPLHGRRVFGDTAFENGKAQVSIAGGDTYRITGIPLGWFYLVEEEESEGYSVNSSGASGVIMSDHTTVHFTNTKEENTDEPVSITLKKKLSGRYEDMDEEEFIFHFFLGGLEPQAQYHLSDGQIYYADEAGGADFSYRLKEDESVTLLDIPSGASYQVCEEGGDYLASYEIETDEDEDPLISSRKTNESRDHFLSTALETAGGGNVRITFTNRFEYVQNITVQKQCTYESDDEFEFTAQFSGLEENDVIESDAGDLKPDENGNIRKTFFIKDSEQMIFRNIPVGVTYVFTEEPSPWISEYRIEDLYGRGNVVKQFGTSGQSHSALSTKEETVNQFEDVLITFTNSPEPVSLTVSKQVKGNMASHNAEFTFMVSLNENGMPLSEADYEKTSEGTLTEAGTLSMDNTGKAVFRLKNNETIRFKNLEPGTQYTIEEDSSKADGYQCEVIRADETEEGFFTAGQLSQNDADNSFIFVNKLDAVIPTGNEVKLHSTVLCLLIMAGMLYLKSL